MLIIDEVQTGFGRTGSLFGFEQYKIVPDIITIAKAMGGGMPIGAFVANRKVMSSLTNNPVLGHITTFGGHPVSTAAAYASLKFILDKKIIKTVNNKGKIFFGLIIVLVGVSERLRHIVPPFQSAFFPAEKTSNSDLMVQTCSLHPTFLRKVH